MCPLQRKEGEEVAVITSGTYILWSESRVVTVGHTPHTEVGPEVLDLLDADKVARQQAPELMYIHYLLLVLIEAGESIYPNEADGMPYHLL